MKEISIEASWGFPRQRGGSPFLPPPTVVSVCFPIHKVIQISRRSRSYGRLNSNFSVPTGASEWLEPLHIATGGRWTKKKLSIHSVRNFYKYFFCFCFFISFFWPFHLFLLFFHVFPFLRFKLKNKWNICLCLSFLLLFCFPFIYGSLGCGLVRQQKIVRWINMRFLAGFVFDFFISLFIVFLEYILKGFYHLYWFHHLFYVHISIQRPLRHRANSSVNHDLNHQ